MGPCRGQSVKPVSIPPLGLLRRSLFRRRYTGDYKISLDLHSTACPRV